MDLLSLSPVDLLYGLLGCIFAVLLGAFMAKKQARAFSGQRNRRSEEVAQLDGK